jgi:hypothetical protein
MFPFCFDGEEGEEFGGEEEEAPSCWLCVRERKRSEDMAAICCMDACN